MSHEEEIIRQHAKEVADEAVKSALEARDAERKRALEINDKTIVRTSAQNAARIIVAIIVGTLTVSAFMYRIVLGQDRMQSAIEELVPQSQFASWATALDHQNRNLGGVGIIVPDPADYSPAMRQPRPNDKPTK